jgi:hypothetical protein
VNPQALVVSLGYLLANLPMPEVVRFNTKTMVVAVKLGSARSCAQHSLLSWCGAACRAIWKSSKLQTSTTICDKVRLVVAQNAGISGIACELRDRITSHELEDRNLGLVEEIYDLGQRFSHSVVAFSGPDHTTIELVSQVVIDVELGRCSRCEI